MKNTYRQQALTRRRALSETQRRQASDKITQQLIEYLQSKPAFHNAARLVYRSLDDEVNTAPLLESISGTNAEPIYAPVTHTAEHMTWHRISSTTVWQRGAFGILEPTAGDVWSKKTAAVLICPLVGFDRSGNRLGLGKGCFDHWLAEQKNHILQSIGLAFACQECPPISAEAHDVALDVIITEKEVITCRNN
ncbi:MAG: 5-formyltetrahydrofolate cyclo-ligase [Mariprofundaceae bacterium]